MTQTPENTVIIDGQVQRVGRKHRSTRVSVADQLAAKKGVTPAERSTRSTRGGAEKKSTRAPKSTRPSSTRPAAAAKTKVKQPRPSQKAVTPAFKEKAEDNVFVRNAKTIFLFAAAILLFTVGYVLLASGQEPLATAEPPTEQTSSPNTSTNTGILRSTPGTE